MRSRYCLCRHGHVRVPRTASVACHRTYLLYLGDTLTAADVWWSAARIVEAKPDWPIGLCTVIFDLVAEIRPALYRVALAQLRAYFLPDDLAVVSHGQPPRLYWFEDKHHRVLSAYLLYLITLENT